MTMTMTAEFLTVQTPHQAPACVAIVNEQLVHIVVSRSEMLRVGRLSSMLAERLPHEDAYRVVTSRFDREMYASGMVAWGFDCGDVVTLEDLRNLLCQQEVTVTTLAHFDALVAGLDSGPSMQDATKGA